MDQWEFQIRVKNALRKLSPDMRKIVWHVIKNVKEDGTVRISKEELARVINCDQNHLNMEKIKKILTNLKI